MKNKLYWLVGTILGVLFGVLLTYTHEHLRDLASFFHIPDLSVWWFIIFIKIVQSLYTFALLPFSFLGWGILRLQYYLPPITFGLLGLIAGLLYQKFKNRHVTPFFAFSKRSIVVFTLILLVILGAAIYLRQVVQYNTFHVSNQQTAFPIIPAGSAYQGKQVPCLGSNPPGAVCYQ
jgi:hypothetical protein